MLHRKADYCRGQSQGLREDWLVAECEKDWKKNQSEVILRYRCLMPALTQENSFSSQAFSISSTHCLTVISTYVAQICGLEMVWAQPFGKSKNNVLAQIYGDFYLKSLVRYFLLIGLNQGHPRSSPMCFDSWIPLHLRGKRSILILPLRDPFCSYAHFHPFLQTSGFTFQLV